jgi:hypothetical protein
MDTLERGTKNTRNQGHGRQDAPSKSSIIPAKPANGLRLLERLKKRKWRTFIETVAAIAGIIAIAHALPNFGERHLRAVLVDRTMHTLAGAEVELPNGTVLTTDDAGAFFFPRSLLKEKAIVRVGYTIVGVVQELSQGVFMVPEEDHPGQEPEHGLKVKLVVMQPAT